MRKLWDACVAFRDEHEILCPESCFQMDAIVLAAPELVEAVCNVIGYSECPDD